MVTQFRAPENTILQSSGGTLAANVEKDVVVEWVKAIEPWATPLYDMFAKNKTFNQQTHQWGQSFRIDTQTFLDGSTSAGATSLTVDDGDIFQVGMVIQVADPMTGTTDVPNLTKADQTRITAISGNTLTVTAVAGAHVDNAIVTAVGTTELQNSEHTEAPRQRGTRLFNYPQRFQAKLTADKRAQNMPTWEHESNPLLSDFAEEMKKQKLLLERSIYAGVRTAETSTVPGRFGGMRQFITTNAINNSGAALTLATVEDVLADLWYSTDAKAAGKLVMSLNTARIFDELIVPERRATVNEDELRKGIRRYHLRTGTYEIIETRECPESELWIINPDDIELLAFNGLNWHVSEKPGKDNAVDHDVKAISGDFTLQVNNEKAMARIYNFDPRIATY